MASFIPLTVESLAALQAREAIYYRGPEGELSVKHYVLDGPNRKFGRTVVLSATDGDAWQFDPATVKVGDTVVSKSGAKYTVAECSGEDDGVAVTAHFEGLLTDDKLSLFSTEPKAA